MLELTKCARRVAQTSPMKEMIGASKHSSLDFSQLMHGTAAKEHNPGQEVQTDEQLKSMCYNNYCTFVFLIVWYRLDKEYF
jgi:hypothetical protein